MLTRLTQVATLMVAVFCLLWILYSQKIKMTFSVYAALTTINVNSGYFIVKKRLACALKH